MPRDLSGKEAERARERDGLLERAVDFAMDRRNAIDLVLIAGDLFDTHQPSHEIVESAIRSLERLARAGIAIITVPGNHDEVTYASSVYRICASRWPGVVVRNPNPDKVTTLIVRDTPVHVYSLAYTGGITQTRPPIKDFPRTAGPGIHLAAFHGSLDWDGGDRSLPLEGKALSAAGYDYVALGHIHGLEERGRAVYCGATEGKGFDDRGTGTFVVAEVSERACHITTYPAGTRVYHAADLDLTGMRSPDDLYDAVVPLAQAHGKDLVRIRLSGQAAFTVDIAEIEARLRDQFYYLEISAEAAHLSDADIDGWAHEPTIRGEFIRRITAQLADASTEDRPVLERALHEGLNALKGSDRR